MLKEITQCLRCGTSHRLLNLKSSTIGTTEPLGSSITYLYTKLNTIKIGAGTNLDDAHTSSSCDDYSMLFYRVGIKILHYPLIMHFRSVARKSVIEVCDMACLN